MIVPEKANYHPIKNVMLASDFKNTFQSTPSTPIKQFLELTRPSLHIVNVDPEHYIEVTESYRKESDELNKIFIEYTPSFYFMRLYGLEDALNLFAEEKKIDLLISIRKNETFLERIFKRSNTRSLTYQSKLPILVVHE